MRVAAEEGTRGALPRAPEFGLHLRRARSSSTPGRAPSPQDTSYDGSSRFTSPASAAAFASPSRSCSWRARARPGSGRPSGRGATSDQARSFRRSSRRSPDRIPRVARSACGDFDALVRTRGHQASSLRTFRDQQQSGREMEGAGQRAEIWLKIWGCGAPACPTARGSEAGKHPEPLSPSHALGRQA